MQEITLTDPFNVTSPLTSAPLGQTIPATAEGNVAIPQLSEEKLGGTFDPASVFSPRSKAGSHDGHGSYDGPRELPPSRQQAGSGNQPRLEQVQLLPGWPKSNNLAAQHLAVH